jgi:Rap1a immunity proteins
MNRTIIFAAAFLCVVASAQVQQRQQLSGRYFTPDTLLTQLQNAGTERLAMSYLQGAYDLTQDAGRSCAQRGTTTPVLLEKIFTDYLQANPGFLHADRTAGGIAAQAFAQYWPCQNG